MEAEMDDERKIYARRGPTAGFQDPDAEISHLADTVAAALERKVVVQDGQLIWIDKGQRIGVSMDILDKLISANVVTQRLVNRGTEAEPNWILEFAPLRLPGPMLRALFTADSLKRGSLVARIGEA
jgi:hypothetical protein